MEIGEVFSPSDILVFNPETSHQGFEYNIGPASDEYVPTHTLTVDHQSSDEYNGDIVKVQNSRTGEISSGFLWRFKKKEDPIFRYDPRQAGDTDEDV